MDSKPVKNKVYSTNQHIIDKIRSVLIRNFGTVTKNSFANKQIDKTMSELTNYLNGAPPDNMSGEENIIYLIQFLKYENSNDVIHSALKKFNEISFRYRFNIEVELCLQVYELNLDAVRKERCKMNNKQRKIVNTVRRHKIRQYFKSSPKDGGLGMILKKERWKY